VKALSMKEPWATLLLHGKKTIETRVWRTNYRGKILLCASKNPRSPIAGKAFAIAELVDCRPMIWEDEAGACCPRYEGAYAWVLADITPLKEMFEVKGQLGLFEVEIGTVRA
jgi:hypothetical protein